MHTYLLSVALLRIKEIAPAVRWSAPLDAEQAVEIATPTRAAERLEAVPDRHGARTSRP